MTNKIIAVQGNHPSKLNPKSDTSVFLANEIQSKYKIFYYDPKNLSIINSKVAAEGFFIKFDYNNKKFFKILKKQKLNLELCKFILIRQDPPFNLEYISTTYILDQIKHKVKIINDPTSIRNVSEKLYSAKYQKFMPATIFSQNLDEIKSFFKKNKKVIVKPIHSYSGNDILLMNSYNSKTINKFIKKHDHIMCQKFLPKISKGDKRVFIINGKVVGAISRVPKKGSFLSNMSKGAVPINIKLTKSELKISKLISKDLKKENIFFAGIDFIDQKLNGDINVTSPTGLKSFYDLSGINLAKLFWKELKA
ncbi:glutathione synthase [Candidatus Pelagibacter sp. HIMB1321]|uniref:glutathione synthase n=1 Tax=Candidatus Pelagibacter sp. HIMB1321 TaxID=1388755 RepID=UPI000A07F4D7|nr:glutathione synthase [Candidatus Pelagibacter sp. HIMB1321]SMF72173.1 glutathione synthase [Candidatus Pelagibacter sp. HIMB1321]